MKIKIVWFSLITLCLISIVFCSCCNKRTHFVWYVDVKLSDCERVQLKIDRSYKKICAFPSGPLEVWRIGGDDCKYYINFKYKLKEYFFTTNEMPFLINVWGNNIYIATLSYLKDKNLNLQYRFRFFKYCNEWKEISKMFFPKQIAIENIFFSIAYPHYESAENLVYEEYNLINSETYKLWYVLENNIKIFTKKDVVNEKFAVKYLKEYLDPFWKEKGYNNFLPKVIKAEKSFFEE